MQKYRKKNYYNILDNNRHFILNELKKTGGCISLLTLFWKFDIYTTSQNQIKTALATTKNVLKEIKKANPKLKTINFICGQNIRISI